MTWSPGWWVDPTLPVLPEGAPRCDLCGRRLTDIAADNGRRLPNRHPVTPDRPLYEAKCRRTRDDLLCLVFVDQLAAAGLPLPRGASRG